MREMMAMHKHTLLRRRARNCTSILINAHDARRGAGTDEKACSHTCTAEMYKRTVVEELCRCAESYEITATNIFLLPRLRLHTKP